MNNFDRRMISPGYFERMNAVLEIDDTIVFLLNVPAYPGWESDDFYICDAEGHSYNGSVMRRFELSECFSRDPYVRSYQNKCMDDFRLWLKDQSKQLVTQWLRCGARGVHLTDFEYFQGYNDSRYSTS